MKTFLTALLAAAALAAPVSANASVEQPALSAIATAYVGHPSIVICATSDADWTALQAAQGAAVGADAFSRPELSTLYLRQFECGQLLALRSGRSGWGATFEGGSLMIFTHESTHLTGVYDEHLTECLAGRNAWRMLALFPKTRKRSAIYAAAMEVHRTAPADHRAAAAC